jgi:hypothetical protein
MIDNDPADAPQTFITPGTNSAGANDWVLIFEHWHDPVSEQK